LMGILRTAFTAMNNDAEFQIDSARIDVPRGAPLDGAKIAAMRENLVRSTSPEIAAAYERLKE
jgi:hypothetical protein